uniref:50S ribosomal protein L35 n=1 Tax=Alexandrium monilatum TaxID=311494 RepID=A0A7S4R092_9DINO
MQPRRRTRPALLCAACAAAVLVAVAAHHLAAAFLAPAAPAAPPPLPPQPPSMPTVPVAGTLSATLPGEAEGLVPAGMALAGAPPQGVRDVNVAMYNKKRTRRDRSEGWTNRKKFRTCSTLARAATKKGRKILRRQTLRGKKHPSPGDYINHKMQPTTALR